MKRLNFDFSEEQIQELEALEVEIGARDMKDLFNTAITVLQWTVDETKAGNEIAAVNDKERRYRVLVLRALRKVRNDNPINVEEPVAVTA